MYSCVRVCVPICVCERHNPFGIIIIFVSFIYHINGLRLGGIVVCLFYVQSFRFLESTEAVEFHFVRSFNLQTVETQFRG